MGETRLALDDTLQVHLKTLGPQLDTLQLSPNSTIIPPELTDTAGQRAIGLLSPAQTPRDAVELGATIGEGGMGIVHSATQRSLGRTVAVKTLREDHRNERDVLTLLREAWVTGSLEHPNILPIYDVKLDDEGMPLVVLKRIEGVDWGELMHDAEQMEERFGEGELLEQNLKVLTQVCHAIAFAHSRGIVHRDIKPENVRIGAFGEVYVLDWGIAVALEDDGTGRFPLAANANAMAGTPSYMAPEMLGGDDAEPISPRTDIYLLGATLCEVATGRPPHDGPTAAALITSVLRSKPKLDGVPPELAQVIERCMDPDPMARFESADEVRTAIQRFADHRGSDKLASIADARLAELEDIVRNADEEVRIAAHDLLGMCRAGFAAALEMWPDNEHAQQGLQRGLEIMVDYELRRGDARAAADLLEQMCQATDALERRVARGLQKQQEAEERREELEALGKDLDPKTGTKTRLVAAMGVGTLWCLLPLIGAFDLDVATYRVQVNMTVVATIAAMLLFYWGRESLTKTAFNRRLAGTVLSVLGAHFMLLGGAYIAGMEPGLLTLFFPFIWFLTAVLVSISLESRLWPSAVGYGLGFLGSAKWPDRAHYFMSLSNAVVTLNFAVMWRPREVDPPSSQLRND